MKEYTTIIIGTVLLIFFGAMIIIVKKNHHEHFRKCICSDAEGQAGRGSVCQDTVAVNNLYVTNKLTEFSKFPDKGWSTVSPGDIDFPESSGCQDRDHGTWVKWDFTDFGN